MDPSKTTQVTADSTAVRATGTAYIVTSVSCDAIEP